VDVEAQGTNVSSRTKPNLKLIPTVMARQANGELLNYLDSSLEDLNAPPSDLGRGERTLESSNIQQSHET